MKVQVIVPKDLLDDLHSVYKEIAEPVLVAVAVETQNELSNLKPPRPARGSMKFVSEKQRKFVMASIANGDIQVPYQRGIAKQSQRMNRSFKLVRAPSSVSITNSARYWEYVIGEKQAEIHKNRWKLASTVVDEVLKSGVVEETAQKIIDRQFGR